MNNRARTKSRNAQRWLEWAWEIQSLSQTGIYYSSNDFEIKRLTRLQEISAEIIDEHASIGYDRIVEIFDDQSGYTTPRVDVRGAVFRDDKLLMVREVLDGGWTMPGGWADVNDFPSEAVEREVVEETGFLVKARRIIGIYDANRIEPLDLFHAYKILFYCEIISGEARSSDETSEVGFFRLDEIPHPFSGERTKQRHVEHAFNNLKDPNIPVWFD
jgi:ADP-ribose pyrophosphatase YjhB (NUDIX family)